MSGTRKSRASGNRERSLSNLRPWQPGQSGNPSGRPKGITAATRERIDAHGGPEVVIVDVLIAQLQRPNLKPLEAVALARELSDRGYGKSPAFAAIEGGDPLELEATQRIVGEILDELGARRDAREGPLADASQDSGG